MPTFDLDLDVDDIIYEMNTFEKKEMYEALRDDLGEENLIQASIKGIKIDIPNNPSLMDEELLKALLKIFNSRYNLSSEEEDYLINFSKKF